MLGSKDDLTLKALLDIVLCDGTRYYGLIINESMFHVCKANLITYVRLCECLDLVMNESICMANVHNDVVLDFYVKLQPNGLLFFKPFK